MSKTSEAVRPVRESMNHGHIRDSVLSSQRRKQWHRVVKKQWHERYNGLGGNNLANLFDSNGDDVFTGGATISFLNGTGFNNVARNFKRVNASATIGNDIANLFDCRGNDRFLGSGCKGILTGQGSSFLNFTDGFDTVRANANGGGIDTLTLQNNVTFNFVELETWENLGWRPLQQGKATKIPTKC